MCYIHWKPEDWDYPRSPDRRPRPQLKWVIPVDITELGASLAAYLHQSPQITALRLCHRFGEGALSRLPQEILDHVISDAHRMEKAALQPKWVRKSLCFQGRCTRYQHRQRDQVAAKELFTTSAGEATRYINEALSSCGYLELLTEDTLDQSDDDFWDEESFEVHEEGMYEWVRLLCLCNKTAAPKKTTTTFAQLNNVLKTEFGLEAIILHEVLSDKLRVFLPHNSAFADCSYHTTCFLTFSETGSDDENALFLEDDDHLAYHETVDLARLMVNKSQRIRFARAMRILDLQPYYHLTELEAIINPTTLDDSSWEICLSQLPGCPKPTDATYTSKQRKLRRFLKSKSDGMAKESWPQLKIITASDAVGPSYQ